MIWDILIGFVRVLTDFDNFFTKKLLDKTCMTGV